MTDDVSKAYQHGYEDGLNEGRAIGEATRELMEEVRKQKTSVTISGGDRFIYGGCLMNMVFESHMVEAALGETEAHDA